MNNSPSLSNWISHLFDHPVTDPAWHWAIDAPAWDDSEENTTLLVAQTFEGSGELLSVFTDAQLNQGFWYLISASSSSFIVTLSNLDIPLELRLRALRSFVPLFEQVMSVRCSPHLSHIDESGATPLNSACYMWWDLLPIHGHPDQVKYAEFDSEVLNVLRCLLEIPHDACRESALHGIGEWSNYYPNVAGIVDEFLARTPGLRPELVAYAQNAKSGNVL